MTRDMLRRAILLITMLFMASMAVHRLVVAALSAEEEGPIIVADSRVYSLKELSELMTAGTAEYHVDRAHQENLMFVSAGQYPRAFFERAIEEGTGLKWREGGTNEVPQFSSGYTSQRRSPELCQFDR
jgi:hypothetical protein